ncbi:hypothetical protein OAO35_00825 [Euryarchaeota archaeon]|jgi:hypothetical protein|nr:hypothetical protein [Euryarchaeota archaeon]
MKNIELKEEILMSTAATTKIIKMVGSTNPPSLVALLGGSLGERKAAISDLANDLFSAGLNIIDFNARRYLSENDLLQPLIQQIVTELKSKSDTSGANADLVNRINESAPALNSTHLTSENRIELIHQFDSALKQLAAINLQKKPLIVIIQGLERAPVGSFMSISEFISDYLNLSKFVFVISAGEELLESELSSSNSTMSKEDFFEDIFNSVVNLDKTEVQKPKVEPRIESNNPDLFSPPVGLEVQSGSDLMAKRKGRSVTPKHSGKPSSRIFKVRELSGKKASIRKNASPKKRIIKKKVTKDVKKFKAISKQNNLEQFITPIKKGDIFAVKKFWNKVSRLKYEEFTELVENIIKEIISGDSRIRATAITALASISKGVSWEMPPDVMDRALIMTGDGSKVVRDAAAEAIKEMTEAGVEKTAQEPQESQSKMTKKNTNSMELTELDTDSMLGTSSNIGSMALGSGSGGVKVMGGESTGISTAPTFELSKEVPSFKEEKKPPKFTAVKDKPPKFNAVSNKKPKFKIAKE